MSSTPWESRSGSSYRRPVSASTSPQPSTAACRRRRSTACSGAAESVAELVEAQHTAVKALDDCAEARMDLQATEQTSDVVSRGLERDSEALRDLLGVVSLGEEPKNLLLPWREGLASVRPADVERPKREDHAENADDRVITMHRARPQERLDAPAVAAPQLETVHRGRYAAKRSRETRPARLVQLVRQHREERVACVDAEQVRHRVVYPDELALAVDDAGRKVERREGVLQGRPGAGRARNLGLEDVGHQVSSTEERPRARVRRRCATQASNALRNVRG